MVRENEESMALKPAARDGALPTRALGRSGLDVTIVGFGAAPLGDLYARLDDAIAIAAVEAAYRAGIRVFDTSPHYGNGLSEQPLRHGVAADPARELRALQQSRALYASTVDG